jgi:hypothetical protein
MDITQVILDDHEQQRRMFAALDEIDRNDADGLAAVWDRLATFLEVHARAEEDLFYPPLLDLGTGATDADSAEDATEDAIGDHNSIRDAIAESRRHEVGSAAWWEAVDEARRANSTHMAEEERQGLADFRRNADAGLRHELGVRFAAYEAENVDGVESRDLDPDDYVAEHS